MMATRKRRRNAIKGAHKVRYEVIVGNVGTVYDGFSRSAALAKYRTYVQSSKSGGGRAGGEDVALMKDGDISKEYFGRRNPTIRRRSGSVKHRTKKNPKQLLFRTKNAARAYAKAHGAKKFSIRKLKKGR
jgi:hypothetical protein